MARYDGPFKRGVVVRVANNDLLKQPELEVGDVGFVVQRGSEDMLAQVYVYRHGIRCWLHVSRLEPLT